MALELHGESDAAPLTLEIDPGALERSLEGTQAIPSLKQMALPRLRELIVRPGYCTFSRKADRHMSRRLYPRRFPLAVTSHQPSIRL